MSQVRRLYSKLAVCGFLLLAVFAVFGQTANHGFVDYDDNEYVFENPHVSGGLTAADARWALTSLHASNWHPLTWLSHMVDCQLYGLNPGGHHLTNVFLHAAAAILLFLTLQRMTAALWPSAWVAAVFAIHPLRVESVAWVAERKDVLSGLFFMSTLWFYARYAERPASWGRYLLVIASYALGLTAKPMLVTLPFVLLLLDYWPLGRLRSPLKNGIQANRMRLIVEKIPLFVLAAASCAATIAAQRNAIRSLDHLAFSGRVANAAVAYVVYMGKMFYPAYLAVLYPLPKGPPPLSDVIAALAVLSAISAAVFVLRWKRPYLIVGWLWYLGTLVPVIGLVQVGDQAMADRYTYLTQIGLYIAIAGGAADIAGAWPERRWGFAAVSLLVVAALMMCAYQQTQHWRNSESLWMHTLACTSQNAAAHNGLGLALADRGQFVAAVSQYRKALEIQPAYSLAHYNLGLALASLGRFDEAIAHYQNVLKMKPDDYVVHNNLGLALAELGRFDDAIDQYRQALKIKPDYAEAHANLGNALAGQEKFDEAIKEYRRALEAKPDLAQAHALLGAALANRGEPGEALVHFQKALDLASDHHDSDLAASIRAEIDKLRQKPP